MFLLPRLKFLNGKDISVTANHVRYVNSEILRKKVSLELSFFSRNYEIDFFHVIKDGVSVTGDWGMGEELLSP